MGRYYYSCKEKSWKNLDNNNALPEDFVNNLRNAKSNKKFFIVKNYVKNKIPRTYIDFSDCKLILEKKGEKFLFFKYRDEHSQTMLIIDEKYIINKSLIKKVSEDVIYTKEFVSALMDTCKTSEDDAVEYLSDVAKLAYKILK